MTDTIYKGYTIKIEGDADAEDPRTWDNLGTMTLFHRRYTLANEDKKTIDEAREIEADTANYIALPVYGYDHGGLTIATTPFSCAWDSGRLGIIYVSREKVAKEYSEHGGRDDDTIKGYLAGEVKTYDDWITGNVHGYIVIAPDGEEIDSCWGYYGDDFEDNGLLMSARAAIDSHLAERAPLFAAKDMQLTESAPLDIKTGE